MIIGEATGPANIYVQRATLNGRPLAVPRIHHADIAAGGTFRFVMGPRPSAWGTGGEFDASQTAREVASAEVNRLIASSVTLVRPLTKPTGSPVSWIPSGPPPAKVQPLPRPRHGRTATTGPGRFRCGRDCRA